MRKAHQYLRVTIALAASVGAAGGAVIVTQCRSESCNDRWHTYIGASEGIGHLASSHSQWPPGPYVGSALNTVAAGTALPTTEYVYAPLLDASPQFFTPEVVAL